MQNAKNNQSNQLGDIAFCIMALEGIAFNHGTKYAEEELLNR